MQTHGYPPICAVAELVIAMGMTGFSKSQVSRLCVEIDERVDAIFDRPLEGEWPYLQLDATTSRSGALGGSSAWQPQWQWRSTPPLGRLLRKCLPGTRRSMTLETVAAIWEDVTVNPAEIAALVKRLNTLPENNLHHVLEHYIELKMKLENS